MSVCWLKPFCSRWKHVCEERLIGHFEHDVECSVWCIHTAKLQPGTVADVQRVGQIWRNITKSLASCKGERRSRPCDTMWIKLNQVGIEIVHWEIQWEFPFIPIQWRSGCQSACWKIFDVEIFLKRWKSPILPSWYNSAVLSDHQHGTFRCLVIRNKLSAFGHSD